MPNQTENAKSQAIAQFHSIVEMVSELRRAEQRGDYSAQDSAREQIEGDALSVEVRSDWHAPGGDAEPAEFCILLCTGGPAVRIIGELDRNQPSSARIQYQDWFTPWTDWTPCNWDNVEKILLHYAAQFYFGE